MRSHRLKVGFALALASAFCAVADDLPKGEAVMDKFVEATGGKVAYSKVHSMVVNGSTEFKAMGMKAKMAVYTAEPDKAYTEMEIAGVGKMQEGSNGDVAWSYSAMQGPRVKDGDERAEALLHAKFNAELNWRDVYKSAETAGVEQVDGKDCYKVVLMPNTGPAQTKWFDKSTGLLVKSSMTSKTPMGDVQAESTYSDYRKEGDFVVAHKVATHVATMELVMTVESVQANADIPKDKFDPPAEVKALMKK